jgi:hypothetical protein
MSAAALELSGRMAFVSALKYSLMMRRSMSSAVSSATRWPMPALCTARRPSNAWRALSTCSAARDVSPTSINAGDPLRRPDFRLYSRTIGAPRGHHARAALHRVERERLPIDDAP